MNDRFKFRYFNKYANKMVKPENWQNVDGIYECIKQQVCFDEDIAPLPYDHIGNGLIFMQCTGLKDHTGKLIFEGDIVKLSYNGGQFTLFGDKFSENPEPDYFLVEYSECWQQYFCQKLPLNYPCAIQLEKLHMSFEHDLYPNNADVKARHELNKAILVNDYDKFSEVIGNQYENPELLEREW